MEIILFLLITTISESSCKFEKGEPYEFHLSYKGMKTMIDVNASDAHLLLCHPWKEFPHLLITEVDLGSSGTTSLHHEIDLIVLDIQSGKIVMRKKIKETTQKKDPKTGKIQITTFEEPYKLQKNKKGEPTIFFPKTSKEISIFSK